PHEVDRIAGDPVGPPLRSRRAVGDQIRFPVRRVLQIAAKVDDVGRADLYSRALAAGFAKQGRSRCVGCLRPHATAIRGRAESSERAEGAPIAAFTVYVFQGVGSVVPYATIDQAACRVPTAVRRGIAGERAQVYDLQFQRIVANDAGLTSRGGGVG